MRISDSERREVAARLREIMRDNPHGWLDVMVWEAVVDVMGVGVTIGETLADLIDRPTCRLVELWDEHEKAHVLDCTACHFGEKAIKGDDYISWAIARELWTNGCYDNFKYCPVCGAEVVSGNGD